MLTREHPFQQRSNMARRFDHCQKALACDISVTHHVHSAQLGPSYFEFTLTLPTVKRKVSMTPVITHKTFHVRHPRGVLVCNFRAFRGFTCLSSHRTLWPTPLPYNWRYKLADILEGHSQPKDTLLVCYLPILATRFLCDRGALTPHHIIS
jgi:hypothetical protein